MARLACCVLAIAIALVAAACVPATGELAIAPDTAARRIEQNVRYLAADERAGRKTGSAGHEDAAQYVAAEFNAAGLKPGGDEGWFQYAPLVASTRNIGDAYLSVSGIGAPPEELVHLRDYLIARPATSSSFAVSAPAVFVGYGVVDPAGGRNDYEGVDTDGKIVVMLAGSPQGEDAATRTFLSSARRKTEAARAVGALGIVMIRLSDTERSDTWARIVSNPERSAIILPPDPERVLDAQAVVNELAAPRLFAHADFSFADVRRQLTAGGEAPRGPLNVSISLRGGGTLAPSPSPNVVGVIEGGDPALRDEVVVVSAHLDHIGVNEGPRRADRINNGALDNAMGVSTIIEAARHMASTTRPRRTVIFLATTAEEDGLLGAQYFARNFGVDGRRIVANINIDMPVVLVPLRDVIAIGGDKSTLGADAAAAAADLGLGLAPDVYTRRGFFTRSDHYAFVEQGIPSIFTLVGPGGKGGEAFDRFMRLHYHKPTDDISLPINYEAAAQFAELNYRIIRRVADASAPPAWRADAYFGRAFGGVR